MTSPESLRIVPLSRRNVPNWAPNPMHPHASPTETLMVAAMFEPLQVGEEFEMMPPHWTVFPWFTIAVKDYPVFDADIKEEAIGQTSAPMPEGGDAVFFGEDETIPARKFAPARGSFNPINRFYLHAFVYRAVNSIGGIYDTTFTGINYNPHISDSSERSLAEGEVVVFNNLTIFKKDIERQRKLVKAVHLWENIDEITS